MWLWRAPCPRSVMERKIPTRNFASRTIYLVIALVEGRCKQQLRLFWKLAQVLFDVPGELDSCAALCGGFLKVSDRAKRALGRAHSVLLEVGMSPATGRLDFLIPLENQEDLGPVERGERCLGSHADAFERQAGPLIRIERRRVVAVRRMKNTEVPFET